MNTSKLALTLYCVVMALICPCIDVAAQEGEFEDSRPDREAAHTVGSSDSYAESLSRWPSDAAFSAKFNSAIEEIESPIIYDGELAGPLAETVVPNISFPDIMRHAEKGAWQIVDVRYTINGDPVASENGTSQVSVGSVMPESFVTDVNGEARLYVKRDDPGPLILNVMIGARSAIAEILFFDANTDQHPHLGPLKINSNSKPIELVIKPDQIGLLATPGVDSSTVMKWATKLSLSLLPSPGGGLYILGASADLNQNSRWLLSRQLKKIGREKIRASGLLAKLRESDDPIVITDTIYVRFNPTKITPSDIEKFFRNPIIGEFEATSYGSYEYRFRLNPDSGIDPLLLYHSFSGFNEFIYLHPDVAQVLTEQTADEPCQTVPPNLTLCAEQPPNGHPWCDTYHKLQWSHENTDEITADADADVREAWQFTQGSDNTLVAVIDSGFSPDHYDLAPNYWINPETNQPGIVLVESENSLMNDYLGNSSYRHGTAAAGVIAAYGGIKNPNLNWGIAGACPRCKILPIRIPLGIITGDMKEAFKQAVDNGADVVSMSLTFPLTTDNVVYDVSPEQLEVIKEDTDLAKQAIYDGAVDKGTVMVFTMANEKDNDCENPPLSSAMPAVIAVGGSTNLDKRSEKPGFSQGYGDCMDLIAPTAGGTKGITTTTVVNDGLCGMVDGIANDFGGNSAATPLVAGIAALIRDLAPSLTPFQVQAVLQDTADRIQADQAGYSEINGFSRPSGTNPSTHAYGRINAFEAVRLIAPAELGGQDNMDIFLRDHELDWGNTEQPSNTDFNCCPRGKLSLSQSKDIKVQFGPQTSDFGIYPEENFDDLPEQQSTPLLPAQVHVRLRNRGHKKIASADLRLHWTIFDGDELPNMPQGIWNDYANPDGQIHKWHTLTHELLSNLEYSGSSIAGCPERAVPECPENTEIQTDNAQVVSFDLPAIDWDPDCERLVLLAAVDSPADHLQALRNPIPAVLTEQTQSVLENVIWDNNVTIWISDDQRLQNGSSEQIECASNGTEKTNLLLMLLAAVILLIIILVVVMKMKSKP